MLSSYHNHTFRCNHATGTEEEYILHAIKHGYNVLGFSDHAPHTFHDMLFASRMRPWELQNYVDTISALREKYKDYIDIKIGLELEYYPLYHNMDMELYRNCGIEYLIMGQHAVGYRDSNYCRNSFELTATRDYYTDYINQCIEGLNTGDFCYLAHPDVFHYKGDDDFYRSESDRLIKRAIELDIPLELNILGLTTGRHYPNPLFWERASYLGAKVILGRDAHDTERVHNPKEFPLANSFAKKHHLNLIDSINIKYI